MTEKQKIAELEERMMTLEIRTTYQEKTIEALDEVIREQFELIDKLSEKLDLLQSRVEDMPAVLATQKTDYEVPPHY